MANSAVMDKCYLCNLFEDYSSSDILSKFAAQHKCLKRYKSDKKYESSEKLQIHHENSNISVNNPETDITSAITIPENKILDTSLDFALNDPVMENDPNETEKQEINKENIREPGYR